MIFLPFFPTPSSPHTPCPSTSSTKNIRVHVCVCVHVRPCFSLLPYLPYGASPIILRFIRKEVSIKSPPSLSPSPPSPPSFPLSLPPPPPPFSPFLSYLPSSPCHEDAVDENVGEDEVFKDGRFDDPAGGPANHILVPENEEGRGPSFRGKPRCGSLQQLQLPAPLRNSAVYTGTADTNANDATCFSFPAPAVLIRRQISGGLY